MDVRSYMSHVNRNRNIQDTYNHSTLHVMHYQLWEFSLSGSFPSDSDGFCDWWWILVNEWFASLRRNAWGQDWISVVRVHLIQVYAVMNWEIRNLWLLKDAPVLMFLTLTFVTQVGRPGTSARSPPGPPRAPPPPAHIVFVGLLLSPGP